MPIEIRELVVRATADVAAGGGTPAEGPEAPAERTSGGDREAVVEACVREVMRLLRRSRER